MERPVKAGRREDGEDEDGSDETMLPSVDDEEDEDLETELIDESESEAAPAAID